MMSWSSSKRAQLLLAASAAVVALVTAYKMLMNKELAPLVFLQGLSMWSTCAVVPTLLTMVGATGQTEKATARAFKVQMVLNLGFIANFIAIFKGHGSTCTAKHVIPFGFYVNFALFVLCYLNIKSMHKENWMIEWKPCVDKKCIEKDLFENQSNRLYATFSTLVKLHAVEIVAGIILAKSNISCINNGQNWAYKNAVGSIFFVIHIIGTMMGAGLIRAVFVKSPKSTGYFMIDEPEAKVEDASLPESKKDQ